MSKAKFLKAQIVDDLGNVLVTTNSVPVPKYGDSIKFTIELPPTKVKLGDS